MSNPNSASGPPLRALAMVLIALAIVFAGLGAMSLSNSSADSAASGSGTSAETSPVTAAPQVPAGTTVPKSTGAVPTTAAATAPATTTAAASGTATTTSGAVAPAARSVPVRVLNNSMVPGLAAKTADQLTAHGWNVAETGNYPGANLPKTTVYYGTSTGEREAAQAIADELGAAVEPKSSGIGDSSPGVTVIVTGN